MLPSKEDFYIGYLPSAAPALAAWLRRKVLFLMLLMLGLPAALVLSMQRFSPGVFEYGQLRRFEGTLELSPFPILKLERPGEPPTAGISAHSSYLLVAEGKFGAEAELQRFEGQRISLEGTLIYNAERTLIEVRSGSAQAVAGDVPEQQLDEDLGTRTLRGEIVDSKCFLGVMKPGNLKPHRACAVRCISGGIPPVLAVKDTEGRATYFLLVGPEGEAVNQELLDYVARPVSIAGKVVKRGEWLFLYARPDSYKLL